MENYILLIECSDKIGLIHLITGVLYRNSLNITSNAEFVDRRMNHFYMRTEIAGVLDEAAIISEVRGVLPAGAIIKLAKKENKDVVILVTKEHHCLSDLLIRNYFKELDINVKAVIGNYNLLAPLVGNFNIPFHFITHENCTREEHEKQLSELIDRYNPYFLVLAKYMRILSSDFISRYRNRIINIHHSFLPAFVGAKPYEQAYERGVKIIGATAHFVNEELDQGPIIAQNVIPVAHSHSAIDMAQAGKDVEKIVLAKALKLVLEERVFVSGNKTVIFD